jgi:hypothetical protein
MRRFSYLSLAVGVAILSATGPVHSQSIGAIQARRQQLVAALHSCQQQMNQHLRMAAAYAMQGRVLPPPPCVNNQPGWIAQLWQLDIALARANGDRRHPCQIEYIRGCENYRN